MLCQLVLVATVGCRPPPGGVSDRPIELVVNGDPETLDPRHSTDAVSIRVTRLLHAGLTRLDPDTLEVRPYLAASFSWEGDRTLTVDLRTDVRFHSGKPLTPNDIVATIAAIRSPQVGSRHARIVDAIDTVTEVGPHRVRIVLNRKHATLLSDLEMPILRADQAWDPPHPSGDLDGLGPYALAKLAPGDVILEPADGGALPKPAHAIRIRTVRDENARALRLVGGRTDAAINVVSPVLLPSLASEPGLEVRSRWGANVTYAVVRGRGDLADADVRRAMSLAIDRDTIAKGFFGSHAVPASSWLAPGHWAHTDMPKTQFDVARARDLLHGRHPRIEWLTTPDRLRSQIARYMAQTLGEAGFEVSVTTLEFGALVARLNAGEFDCANMQIPELGEPNVLRVFLHSTMAPPAGANRARVNDPEVDAALDEGASTTDPILRRLAYAKLESVMAERLHLIPLLHEEQVIVSSARARGFMPSADGRWLGLAELR